ncbi:MAG: O-antigen ligase family protein [Candidatus Dormibacterales bacterium]
MSAEASSAQTRLGAIERWTLRTIAFVLPLTFWPLTFDHYVLPKLLVARFLVLALAALFVARAAVANRLVWKRTPLDLPLLAFIGSAVVSAVFGVNLGIGIFGTYARYDGLLTLCTYGAIFWLTVQSIRDAGEARALQRALIASGFVVAVIAIVQWIGDSVTGQPARAYGTMGNANVLGAFLVLLCPVAYVEVLSAKSALTRLLAGNALAAMLLALLLTLSRSSWIGLAIAIAILLFGQQLPAMRNRLLQAATVALVLSAAALAPVGLEHGTSTNGAVSQVETVSDRLHVWTDTIPLVAARPLIGYGPDTFGLVYPRYQSGNWGYYAQFDKAHSELLQVAATQGVLGVAAYLWLLAAVALAFWRGPRFPEGWGLLAGWAGYEVVLQFNFTALPAALPMWILVAAAVVIWSGGSAKQISVGLPSLRARLLALAVIAGLAALAVPALGSAYLADAGLLQAYHEDVAGHRAAASVLAAAARRLAPQESVYAVEVGNLAFEAQDWARARDAYSSAAKLGTFNPEMYRNLAVADSRLGYVTDARDAARAAVYLDRFDPANQALLAQMELLKP